MQLELGQAQDFCARRPVPRVLRRHVGPGSVNGSGFSEQIRVQRTRALSTTKHTRPKAAHPEHVLGAGCGADLSPAPRDEAPQRRRHVGVRARALAVDGHLMIAQRAMPVSVPRVTL